MPERGSGGSCHRFEIGVVGHDRDELTSECSCTPTEDQVIEAVAEFGDHDDDPRRRAIVDLELGVDPAGEMLERADHVVRAGLPGRGEFRTYEERVSCRVVELSMVNDLAAVTEQERRDGVHDAAARGAPQGQREGRGHGELSGRGDRVSGCRSRIFGRGVDEPIGQVVGERRAHEEGVRVGVFVAVDHDARLGD